MGVEVFVSTINNSVNKLDKSILEYKNCRVINQVPENYSGVIQKKVVTYNNCNILWYNLDSRGLSRSRNAAINLANQEFVYLTDDDIILVDDFEKIVLDSFSKNSEFDILAFKVEGIEKKFKNYAEEEKIINKYNALKLSSVEFIMRTKSIKGNGLNYDERFGAGSKYKMGEENIFINDALKKGLKIKYIPSTIAYLHIDESSWFDGFNQKYFYDRGAIYKRLFGFSEGLLWSFAFCIRKYKLYKNQISLFAALKSIIKGIFDNEKN